MLTVNSRSLFTKIGGKNVIMMIPFVDMLNHNENSNTKWSFNSNFDK